jgi:hypothetical protein
MSYGSPDTAELMHRRPEQQCKLCGACPMHPCVNVFTGKPLDGWKHWQPVRVKR